MAKRRNRYEITEQTAVDDPDFIREMYGDDMGNRIINSILERRENESVIGFVPGADTMRERGYGYSAALQGPSAMRDAQADPSGERAQREALNSLIGAARLRGLGASGRADTGNAVDASGAQDRAGVDAARRNAIARGMRGGGAELEGAMAGGGNAAMMRAGLGSEQRAQQRALQSLAGFGGMGSQMRGQSFDEGMRRAGAQDEITMRNQRNRSTAQQFTGSAGAAAAMRNAGIGERRFGMAMTARDIAAGNAAEANARRAADEAKADQRRQAAIGTASGITTNLLNTAIASHEDDEDAGGRKK